MSELITVNKEEYLKLKQQALKRALHQRRYYEKNKATIQILQKQYYQKNKQRYKDRYQRDKEKLREKYQKRKQLTKQENIPTL